MYFFFSHFNVFFWAKLYMVESTLTWSNYGRSCSCDLPARERHVEYEGLFGCDYRDLPHGM